MKWRYDSVGRFYDSNESTVVYFDSDSGDTHLLSNFAAYVMQHIGDQPMTTEELVNQIVSNFESEELSDLKDAIPGVLEELVALDILKRD